MKILEQGRIYLVKNFSGNGYQEIKFNRKKYNGEYLEGTTVEELLRVLRDKFYHFDRIEPSEHNKLCIEAVDSCLRECLLRLGMKKELLKDKE